MNDVNLEAALVELQAADVPADIEVQMSFEKNLPKIINNLDEVGKWLELHTRQDKTLIVTEDNEDYAKQRCATYNKIIAKIEDDRKAIKKEYTAPLTVLEKKCKEVVAIAEEAKNNMWGQITKADLDRKAKKTEALKAYYDEQMQGAFCPIPFGRVLNTAWLNKGTSLDKAKAAIDEICQTQKEEIEIITALEGGNTATLLVEYAKGKTLAEVIRYNKEFAEQKKKLDKAMEGVREVANKTPAPIKYEDTEQGEPIKILALEFKLTPEHEQILKDTIKQHRIPCRRI